MTYKIDLKSAEDAYICSSDKDLDEKTFIEELILIERAIELMCELHNFNVKAKIKNEKTIKRLEEYGYKVTYLNHMDKYLIDWMREDSLERPAGREPA